MTEEVGPLNRFSLLAQAAARRPLAVVASSDGPAYTDGRHLYLPDLTETRFLTCLFVHSGLLAVGSFDRRAMVRIAGRRRLAARYLVLEAQRAVRAIEATVPIRVLDAVAALHAGLVSESAAESLARAKDRRAQIPEAPPWLGVMKPLTMFRARPPVPVGHGASLLPSPEDDTTDDLELADRSRTLELMSMPVPRLSPMVKKLFGMGAAPNENGEGGKELRANGRGPGPFTPSPRRPRAVKSGGTQRTIPVGLRYPEWDLYRGSYRPQWCTVTEIDPPERPEDEPLPTTTDPSLRRELARLGLTHERHRAQSHGDAIDVTALVDFMVDRDHAASGDPRVYESRRRTGHDLGVLVLLDVTGSTADVSSGGRAFDQQCDLAARLTAALDDLGDRVALYGFYSRGRDAVHYLRIKDFEDRYDQACRRRLGSLSPGGFTRLGAAIRHGNHVLLTRGGTSKLLLVVIGDGRPYENGYEDRHAEQDSRRALQECVASGVGCVCLNVGPALDNDISERVWGEFAHRHLEDAASLARYVGPLFRTALRDAGASMRPPNRESPLWRTS